MKKFKNILALPIACALVFSNISAYANTINEVPINNLVPRIVSSDELEISPRLAKKTVDVNLNTDWTEVYSDNNLFDAVATIQNNTGNKGGINIKIESIDKANVSNALYYSSSNVTPGNAFVSGTISGSSYKKYTVYAKIISPTNAGTYSITYWDNSPK